MNELPPPGGLRTRDEGIVDDADMLVGEPTVAARRLLLRVRRRRWLPLEDALGRLLLLLLLRWEATVRVLLLRWRRADHLALLLHLHLLLLCVIRHLLLLQSVAMLRLLKSSEKVGAAAVRVARFGRHAPESAHAPPPKMPPSMELFPASKRADGS